MKYFTEFNANEGLFGKKTEIDKGEISKVESYIKKLLSMAKGVDDIDESFVHVQKGTDSKKSNDHGDKKPTKSENKKNFWAGMKEKEDAGKEKFKDFNAKVVKLYNAGVRFASILAGYLLLKKEDAPEAKGRKKEMDKAEGKYNDILKDLKKT